MMFNVIPRWALVLGVGVASAAGVLTAAPVASAGSEPAYTSFALVSDQVGEVLDDVTKVALDVAGTGDVVSTAEGSIIEVVSPALGQVGTAAGTLDDAVSGGAGTVNDSVDSLLGVNLGL